MASALSLATSLKIKSQSDDTAQKELMTGPSTLPKSLSLRRHPFSFSPPGSGICEPEAAHPEAMSWLWALLTILLIGVNRLHVHNRTRLWEGATSGKNVRFISTSSPNNTVI